MAMCIYNNCDSVQKPFSSLAFFTLPKDTRRHLWIANSGNQNLATISKTARRVVCEKHFKPSSLRKQFHRTILSRDAIPEKWTSTSVKRTEILGSDLFTDVGDSQSQDKAITLDEKYETEYDDDAQQKANNWHDNYESSATDQTEEALDFESVDCDESSETVNEYVIEIRHANNENNETERTNEEEMIVLHDELPNQFPPFFHEVEIETVDSEKRKRSDGPNPAPIKTRKICENEVTGESVHTESMASDIIVSSSTSKANENLLESLRMTNEEDKYFALSAVAILQRITPQKKAFAKVNILRYLTELEFGMEATIN